ncbi:MAG TPA: nicotinate (nicotinamide) nucleotide adenylyltransferase [Kofleriaceae bacterium]|jgi:nicotinate-nucleotide adenylyltransferase
MRVALFGGSFNPPHAAHQLVALYVLETQPVDELWFVPTFSHPFGKALEAYEHRVAMCELAAAPLGARARVSRAEDELARQPGFVASRTIDLLEHLAGQGHELRWVIGADILGETHKWHRWDDVVARAPLIVVGRPGYDAPGSVVSMPDVSATDVRALLAQNRDAANLVPREVLRYIARHGLYR